ncbi:hypothetical protein TTHERM_01081660 (macronuclear) [Tetrahymena thermophila SB210]|uniref:Uncharacterized protein n=1 Tax=Tetrahymena thermophila (strain SB210) TaxID=312017 RepID=Q22C03_TETTS|nr:hypothetical protein TTHERM_01081660 [Tetrahymena thermophila SB210]EAR82806.1 hypothetical protein TTHERM_01081660 [Tetrahymena thermophila SB210]|eukprot:XP_001030469.1 hypothetical protein TTHERM_01081660 [Tetrahymena thermophila SB210]
MSSNSEIGFNSQILNGVKIQFSHSEAQILREQEEVKIFKKNNPLILFQGFISKMEFKFDDHIFYYSKQLLNDLFSKQKIPYEINGIQKSIIENVIQSDSILSHYVSKISKMSKMKFCLRSLFYFERIA